MCLINTLDSSSFHDQLKPLWLPWQGSVISLLKFMFRFVGLTRDLWCALLGGALSCLPLLL